MSDKKIANAQISSRIKQALILILVILLSIIISIATNANTLNRS